MIRNHTYIFCLSCIIFFQIINLHERVLQQTITNTSTEWLEWFRNHTIDSVRPSCTLQYYRKRCVVSLILILSSYFYCIILLVSERAESHKRKRSSIRGRFICFLLSCAGGWMIMVWNLHYATSLPTDHKTLTLVHFMTSTNGIIF